MPTPCGPQAPGRPRPLPHVPLHPQATRSRPRGGAEARGRRRRRRERFARGSEAARVAGGSYYRGREEEPGLARGLPPGGREARRRRGRPGHEEAGWGLRLWAGGRALICRAGGALPPPQRSAGAPAVRPHLPVGPGAARLHRGLVPGAGGA